ncbi:hypothetical protein [Methanospirillum sp.]|uniref:hypothetical protein n=1 Tax=Methanospirillum sp. TaxID=45200 RepID=UPI002B972B5B|nr:hypothetical protein [Methanospirillum sp.]HOL40659.1 hypothetical protein [Methanospirillum sp.]HPP76971.1 hypothetical protein [Methanospirillum sp.]
MPDSETISDEWDIWFSDRLGLSEEWLNNTYGQCRVDMVFSEFLRRKGDTFVSNIDGIVDYPPEKVFYRNIHEADGRNALPGWALDLVTTKGLSSHMRPYREREVIIGYG